MESLKKLEGTTRIIIKPDEDGVRETKFIVFQI